MSVLVPATSGKQYLRVNVSAGPRTFSGSPVFSLLREAGHSFGIGTCYL